MTKGQQRFNWDEAIIFAYRATFTQTSSTSSTLDIRFRPEAGNQCKILQGTTGADDYSGGETVQVEVRTDTGRIQLLRKIDTAVDNENLPFPFVMTTGNAAGMLSPADKDIVCPFDMGDVMTLQGVMELRVFTSALAENETLKVAFTYKSRAGVPLTVDTSDSTCVSPTTTTQEHKVI